MCLPFCCRTDDQPPDQGGTGKTATHHDDGTGHRDGRTGKEPNKVNGAAAGVGEDFSGEKMGLPALPQQNTEDCPEKDTYNNPAAQAPEQKIASPTQDTYMHKDPKIGESPEPKDHISKAPTLATKGPKQSEHVAATGHRHQWPVEALQPKDKATNTMRTPPSPQIARRGGEDDYYPSATPTVPATNNGLGDRGQDDDHANDGKNDRRPQGKSRR